MPSLPGTTAGRCPRARLSCSTISPRCFARLRLAGGADLYSGGTARQLADAAARAGGALDAEDLRQYRARWVGTVFLPIGYEELHTVPGGGGAVAAAIVGLAAADDRYADAEGAERLHLLAEAGRRGFALAPAATADALDPALLERRMESYRPDARTAGGGDGGPRLDDAPTTGFVRGRPAGHGGRLRAHD